MARQAKYLIDDARYRVHVIGTSWDYDNRVTSDKDDIFPSTLYDNKSEYGVRIKRDFQTQTDGKMCLELFYKTELSADGASFYICSSAGEKLFEVYTKDGCFYLNGERTDASACEGFTRLKVEFDLSSGKAALIVNGCTAAQGKLTSTKDASRIYIGTTGETEIKLTPIKIRLFTDFLVNESFMYTNSVLSDDWQLDGSFEMCTHGLDNPQMSYTYAKIKAEAGSSHSAFIPFERTKEDIIAEGYILLPEGSDGASFGVTGNNGYAFGVTTKCGAFYTLSGEKLRDFTANVWQVIRFETNGNALTVKIDGKKCGVFDIPQNSFFDGIKLEFAPDTDANMCFTDIFCENRIDYPDYCPEPEAVRHPEYEIGMNVCNMWREGHHFGWDRITYFKDNTPLIGPYDEGSPEVADWEIKFMTEHGITFQHFCWYCPDPIINFPIRRSRMDNALRDGFMNARYSDKMKFIIMWENNGYRNTNPEDFKEYVWKYWCEYFFTDERYFKIDNKPLISLWSFRFVEHWGGEEKAHEIIKFMNEDIKRYGCDGVLLMATAGMSSYENVSKYCDLTYSYHFGKEGYMPLHQTSSIDYFNEKHEKDGLVPYLNTASVGFNACPWHGADARVPLITTEDFEKVLRHIKAHADGDKENVWHRKIFMMSTWNEYGEGTYMMPSHLHGFGYLDKIREVFVPESGKCENLLPDESQQKRITYLRKPGRVMIRRLGYEKSEEIKAPNKLVFTADFTGGEKAGWRGFGSSVLLSYSENGVKLTPVSEHQHYSLVFHDEKEKALCNADEVKYIRVFVRSREGDSKIRLAFLTENDKRWASNKCERTFDVPCSDEYTALDFYPGKFETWQGSVTDLRIDNMVKLPYEIQKIQFMTYEDDERKDPTLYVNGIKQRLAFNPVMDGDKFIVSLDPGYGAFRALKLYHEYDAESSTLTVASRDITAHITVDSETAAVNGKDTELSTPMYMRDGLPTLDITELCGIFGYTYRYDNRHLYIETDK